MTEEIDWDEKSLNWWKEQVQQEQFETSLTGHECGHRTKSVIGYKQGFLFTCCSCGAWNTRINTKTYEPDGEWKVQPSL